VAGAQANLAESAGAYGLDLSSTAGQATLWFLFSSGDFRAFAPGLCPPPSSFVVRVLRSLLALLGSLPALILLPSKCEAQGVAAWRCTWTAITTAAVAVQEQHREQGAIIQALAMQ